VSADVTDLADYRRATVSLTPDGRRIRLDVLGFARRGVPVPDIAERLGLSERVVEILLGLRVVP
jgi:DNA-binding NarL/FixJ family response regulator